MKLKVLGAAVLLAGSITPAQAGDFYVLGSVGRSSIDQGKTEIDNVLRSVGATGLASTLSTHDTGYKVQLGYQFNPNWAVEGGYVDLGKTTYSATYTGGAATVSAKATGWNVAAVGMLPIDNAFALFGKLGVIYGKVEVNASATGPGGAASASDSAAKWKPNYGIGATYNFNKNMAVRAEYEQFNKLGDSSTIGTSNVDLFSVGIAVKF